MIRVVCTGCEDNSYLCHERVPVWTSTGGAVRRRSVLEVEDKIIVNSYMHYVSQTSRARLRRRGIHVLSDMVLFTGLA